MRLSPHPCLFYSPLPDSTRPALPMAAREPIGPLLPPGPRHPNPAGSSYVPAPHPSAPRSPPHCNSRSLPPPLGRVPHIKLQRRPHKDRPQQRRKRKRLLRTELCASAPPPEAPPPHFLPTARTGAPFAPPIPGRYTRPRVFRPKGPEPSSDCGVLAPLRGQKRDVLLGWAGCLGTIINSCPGNRTWVLLKNDPGRLRPLYTLRQCWSKAKRLQG